jgi:hypothetical protein
VTRRPNRSSAANRTNRLRTEATDRPSTDGTGEVDWTWALVWHFNDSGRSTGSSTSRVAQHQMDVHLGQLFRKPLPEWLAGR